MAFGEIKRSRAKVRAAGARAWYVKRGKLTFTTQRLAGSYDVRLCVGGRSPPKPARVDRCAVAGGTTPTRALKAALKKLSAKLK